MGGGGGGGMMGGGGGGMGGGFAVPPERIADLTLNTVCLEYGKPDPRPSMHYELRPIEEVTDNVVLQELLRDFGRGKYTDQRAVQAAAWHLADGKSWDELAALKNRRIRRPDEPHFRLDQLQNAQMYVSLAYHAAKEREQEQAQAETEPDYSKR